MSAEPGLWSLAALGSAAIHAAIVGAVLAAMPGETSTTRPATEITIAALPDASAPAIITPGAVEARQTVAVAAAVVPMAKAVSPVAAKPAIPVVASSRPVATAAARPTAVAPASVQAKTAVSPPPAVMPPRVVKDDAAATAKPDTVTPATLAARVPGKAPDAEAAPTVTAEAVPEVRAQLPAVAGANPDGVAAVDLPPEVVAAARVSDKADIPPTQPAPVAPSTVAAQATVVTNQAGAVTGRVATDPIAPIDTVPLATTASIPAETVTLSPSTPTETAGRPAAPSSAVPATRAQPALAGVAAVRPVPAVTPAASGKAPVIAGPPAETRPQIAGIAVPSPPSSGATGHGKMRLSEFLAGYEGGDCLLALPAGAGAMEGFSDAPDAVSRLGKAYERMAGVPIKARARPVSTGQCSALSFSRNLAQYPNYPLQVALDSGTIDSGSKLTGHVSGLRKDTLYLFVVDDEGKAKLIDVFVDMQASSVPFQASVTLTEGPVSAVQLLVAIATDGQLRTVATRPGIPAKTFFDALTQEIIRDNRKILYGITSFVVR